MALEGAVALDFAIDGFSDVGAVDELLLEINTEALLLALEGAMALDFATASFFDIVRDCIFDDCFCLCLVSTSWSLCS